MNDERDTDLGPEARRRRGAAAALTPGLVLAVLIVAVVVGTVGGIALSRSQGDIRANQADIEQQQRSVGVLVDELREQARDRREAEVAACRRLQGTRDQVNRGAAIIYLALTAAPPTTQVARDFRRYAHKLRYIGPTDCAEATDRPRTYRSPEPRPFTRRLAVRVIVTTK